MSDRPNIYASDAARSVSERKGERKSRMTPAALDELARPRKRRREHFRAVRFETGKPLKQPVNDPDLHELAPVWKD